MVDALEQKEADGRYSHFELISCKCVDTYVRVKKNQSQICWKWRKVGQSVLILPHARLAFWSDPSVQVCHTARDWPSQRSICWDEKW